MTQEDSQAFPDCIILAVTNPLDAMVAERIPRLPFPPAIEGPSAMAGVLDTAPLPYLYRPGTSTSRSTDVQAMVLGATATIWCRSCANTTVGCIPLTELLSQDRIDSIVQRTRDGGGEIVALLKQGSAFYAPSAAITEMVEAILLDKKRILPGCAYLEGEYGINGLCVGVPVKIGANGVEQVIEISLTDEEMTALQSSAASVQELVDVMANAEA